MPYNPNDVNYQTKNSRVLSFNDFEENIKKEKDELNKTNRSFIKTDTETNKVPGNKYKYNKVTNKIDVLSKNEIEDDIDSLPKDTKKHIYKIKNEDDNKL